VVSHKVTIVSDPLLFSFGGFLSSSFAFSLELALSNGFTLSL
jgi:hypothetical protein